MARIKQQYKIIGGIKKAICPICRQVVDYPLGIYFRNGVYVHYNCIAVARMRRGKIQGIDF